MQFEYYVINVDSNQKKTAPFNIFSNYRVNSSTEKAIKKYLRSPSKFEYTYMDDSKIYGFEALCEELLSIIAWEECGRFEYEFYVATHFDETLSNDMRWDCYMQCKPNICMIAREVIYQYKQVKKFNCL